MTTVFTPIRAGLRLGTRPEREPLRLPSALEATLLGWVAGRRTGPANLRRFRDTLARIRTSAVELDGLDDLERRRRRSALKRRLASPAVTVTGAIDSFAHVVVDCESLFGVTLHDEQLLAGWAMLHGNLVELRTGEGKTLAAALTAVTVASSGTPVHILTANDYLAARDRDQLAPLYARFGLTVASITERQSADERRQAYGCDVVYCAGKRLVFDHLLDTRLLGRHADGIADRLHTLVTQRAREPLLRGLGFAIVDEADSVLIDEARTPLVLSETSDQDPTARSRAAVALSIARELIEDQDFHLASSTRSVGLSATGRAAIRLHTLHLDGVWRFERYRHELVRQALAALHLYKKDRDYLVEDGAVVLIDETTGRPHADRKLREGLHQMLELKERLELSDRSDTVAMSSFQQFMARYHALAGMSGTLREARTELRTVYRLPIVSIPPHRPCRLKRLPTIVEIDRDRQADRLVDRVIAYQAVGRPVLVGTRTLATSEHVSHRLSDAGIEHRVLNARHDTDEANVIAKAGEPGAITVATNMAGRGCDIPLHPCARAAGGLHVIDLELNDSPRIDRQLFGRAARQGDPGSCESLRCLEDDALMGEMPVWLIRLLIRIHRMNARFATLIANGAFAAARFRLVRRHRRERLALFMRNERLDQQLAVAGH